MPDGARALAHLLRAAEELALAVAAGASTLAGRAVSSAALLRALRAEERRWAERAAHDPAAERVRELFAALCDVLEPPPAPPPRARRARTSAQAKFDPTRRRWDTSARWRS